MSDEKPNPLEDVRKGLGLLFRAARTAVESLPTKNVEEAVVTTAREVGRAVENVAKTVEREVFGNKRDTGKPWHSQQDATKPQEPKEDASKPDEPKPPEGPGAA